MRGRGSHSLRASRLRGANVRNSDMIDGLGLGYAKLFSVLDGRRGETVSQRQHDANKMSESESGAGGK